MLALPITTTMNDPNLFGRWFAGSSWQTWIAILKAAYGLPMTADQITIFKGISGGRNPPAQRVKELWVIAGRRSGKDSTASLIAAYTAVFNDYQQRLRPGERASIACLAVNRDQARIVHRYTKGLFRPAAARPVDRQRNRGTPRTQQRLRNHHQHQQLPQHTQQDLRTRHPG